MLNKEHTHTYICLCNNQVNQAPIANHNHKILPAHYFIKPDEQINISYPRVWQVRPADKK